MHTSFLLIDSAQPQSSAVVNEVAERLLRLPCTARNAGSGGDQAWDAGLVHRRIAVEFDSKERGAFLDEYERCRRILVNAVDSDGRVLVWVLRAHDDTHLNALVGAETYGRLCAMLMLAVPEATFVVAEHLHDMLLGYVLWSHGLSPLLDATRIRTEVRRRMKSDVEVGADASYLALRHDLAVAIDDEESYAYLHAYTAYRNGFRAAHVGSDDLATYVLGMSAPLGQPDLTFEDLFITFADGSHRYSWLPHRDEILPLLATTPMRIFVTSGLRQKNDQEKVEANDKYTASQEKKGRYIKRLAKPQAGMYQLWQKSGLAARLRPSISGGRAGVGRGYVWPPLETEDGPGKLPAEKVTHSADGTLTLIAQSLVDRAQAIVGKSHPSIRESVRGAVLATEALELLGGRTPALSVEALRLKHELEVIAECRFSGVAYHFPVSARFEDITRDAKLIAQWFAPNRRYHAQGNAELSILTRLVRVFVEYGHFNEEVKCTNRIRRVHNRLWLRDYPLGVPVWVLLWYVDLLLVSFSRFVGILVLWIALLAAAYRYAEPDGTHGAWGYVADATTSFFSIGGPVHGPFVWAATAAIVLGFVHLGVFLSHLYSILRRK